MLVQVVAVHRVTMPIVQIIDVVVMRHRFVAASFTVSVIGMPFGALVRRKEAFIPVPVVRAVGVPVVQVIHVVAVSDEGVPAGSVVDMAVLDVNVMGDSHGSSFIATLFVPCVSW